MAQNVTVAGASYTAVPAVDLPKTGGGTATFTDTSPTTAVESDVASGKIFFKSDGSQATGTASGGGGTTWETVFDSNISVEYDTPNNYFIVANFTNAFGADETYRVTWGSSGQYVCETFAHQSEQGDGYAIGNAGLVGGTDTGEPFVMYRQWVTYLVGETTSSTGTLHLKIEKQTGGGGGGSTLVPKTITANGTYDPADDDADGYSEVTVAIPAGTEGTPTATKGSVSNHSISVTPSVTNSAGVISGGTHTGTAVTVSASELVSGSETKTANGTYDVTNLAQLVVSVSGGTSKNTQTVQSTSRRNNTALGSITSLTCSTTGSYDVYWTCARSNTSQTWGSQLYIGGSAYGTENTTWSNNVQNNHLENVSISANQTVAVYGRSRSGYYIYAPQLTIVQK